MIDYESYNKLVKYLEDGDLNKIRAYIEKEKERYYLKNARAALVSYLRNTEFYDYIDENRILLTDVASLYILNSDEILTEEQRKGKKILARERSIFLLEQLKKYENMPYSKVGMIKNPTRKEKQVFSEDGRISHFFDQQGFNYSKKFLGDNISYKICSDISACIAESEKGMGLMLGLRK